jgi:Fe2+ transport system protein FeoA
MPGCNDLTCLEPGQRAVVAAVSTAMPAGERRRILELGFFPGTEVTVVRRSALGDPTAYEVRGLVVALRRAQARMIEVHDVGR